jgi:hypothetical protein
MKFPAAKITNDVAKLARWAGFDATTSGTCPLEIGTFSNIIILYLLCILFVLYFIMRLLTFFVELKWKRFRRKVRLLTKKGQQPYLSNLNKNNCEGSKYFEYGGYR